MKLKRRAAKAQDRRLKLDSASSLVERASDDWNCEAETSFLASYSGTHRPVRLQAVVGQRW